METYLLCTKCADEATIIRNEFYPVEVDNLFFKGKEVTCQNGHTFFLANKTLKSAFLIEQGLYSFNSGFYNEAFNTLYSSFETYKQEVVSLYLYQLSQKIEEVELITKNLFDNSEKTDGAYSIAFYSMFKTPAYQLKLANRKRRNRIIHKGHIANKQDCIKLGNDIFYNVLRMNKMFLTNFDEYTESNNKIKSPVLLNYLADKLVSHVQANFNWKEDFNEKFQIADLSTQLKISPSLNYNDTDIHEQTFEEIAERAKLSNLFTHAEIMKNLSNLNL